MFPDGSFPLRGREKKWMGYTYPVSPFKYANQEVTALSRSEVGQVQ